MPGYEPFLLCDFHVHTSWSDGRLSLREVVDLYGKTGRFDVIAITDHILMKRDLLARAGRMASLGYRALFGHRKIASRPTSPTSPPRRSGRSACTTCSSFPAPRSRRTTSAARRTRTSSRSTSREYISADQPAEDILQEIRRQGALSIACHPHHRTTRRVEIGTCYLWDHRKRLAELVDVWEAANRDDLFSVTSLKHYPYVANSDFHKPKHLYSWKTLLRCEKNWEAIARTLRVERRRRADALSQRFVGGLTVRPAGRRGGRLVPAKRGSAAFSRAPGAVGHERVLVGRVGKNLPQKQPEPDFVGPRRGQGLRFRGFAWASALSSGRTRRRRRSRTGA